MSLHYKDKIHDLRSQATPLPNEQAEEYVPEVLQPSFAARNPLPVRKGAVKRLFRSRIPLHLRVVHVLNRFALKIFGYPDPGYI